MDKQYAYSLMEIKELDDKKRTFRGMATTPTPDRVGDIVEPKGAEFKLPIPLCWMHNTRDPVGWVTSCRVMDKGIEIAGEVAMVEEPASLKERLDVAWAMLRVKLVRGLSIGFKPLESSRIGETYSYRYLKWLWLELSPVTVAANGDCSIESVKSIDQAIRHAASGSRPVIRLDGRPGAGQEQPGASGTEERRKGVIYLSS